MAKQTPVVSIVGAESLLGRELVDVLGSANLPARVKMVAAAEPEEARSGLLTVKGGEPVFLTALQAGELVGSRVVMLAGPPETSLKVAEVVKADSNPAVLVDLAGALEDHPAARLAAPLVLPLASPPAPIYVIANPASIALALYLKQLATVGTIRRIVAHVFEPASERGKRGLDELQQQTVGLLSFQKLKKEVFDTQVSFNMLPQYGPEAIQSLEDVETKVERHLATLLSGDANIPMPSVRVVHAPVFHGHSFSLWVEFENRPPVDELAAKLATERIDVRGKDVEPPSNVGVAGQSGVTAGAFVPDRNDARACWFWGVSDNLRMSADNAVEVVRELLG